MCNYLWCFGKDCKDYGKCDSIGCPLKKDIYITPFLQKDREGGRGNNL